MEHFWEGFEKQAFLQAAARGLGYAKRMATSAASSLPASVKAYPGKLREAFLQGDVAAGNAMASRAKATAAQAAAAKRTAGKGKQVVQKGTQVAQEVAKPAPAPLAGIRGKGKALLTGGLLGAGGVYAAGGDGSPQQPMPY